MQKLRQRRQKDRATMALTPKCLVASQKGRQVDCIDLLLPRFSNSWLQKIISHWRGPHIIIHLDIYGSEVWQAIDGVKTVAELIATLDGEHWQTTDKNDRIVAFLNDLEKKELIILA